MYKKHTVMAGNMLDVLIELGSPAPNNNSQSYTLLNLPPQTKCETGLLTLKITASYNVTSSGCSPTFFYSYNLTKTSLKVVFPNNADSTRYTYD